MPAILSRMDHSSKVEDESLDEIKDVINTQPFPTVVDVPEIPRRASVVIPIENINLPQRLPVADSVLHLIHEEHKNVCPVLCIALLYVFMSGDTNWFIMGLLQIGLQALFFNRSILKSRIGRRVLLFFSLTIMTSCIISLSMIREVVNPRASLAQQLFFYCFFICSFIGFVFTNIYNINLVFVFGRNVRWMLHRDNEEEPENVD